MGPQPWARVLFKSGLQFLIHSAVLDRGILIVPQLPLNNSFLVNYCGIERCRRGEKTVPIR